MAVSKGAVALRRASTGAPDRRAVDLASRSLRARLALELASDFRSTFNRSESELIVASSPFASYVQDFPSEDPLQVFAFNLAITQSAITALAEKVADPWEFTFTAARVAELGCYALYDPERANVEPHLFLGAAKQQGYFFTPPDIAVRIVDEAFGKRQHVNALLDPAAGVGSLIATAVLLAKQGELRLEGAIAVEADGFTAQLCERVLKHVRELVQSNTEIKVIHADALAYPVEALGPFDCIVMNPPYGRIKFLRSSLTNNETRVSTFRRSLTEQDLQWRSTIKERGAALRDLASQIGAGGGTLDYERLFIALAANLLERGARCAFIAPSTWLGDRESLPLRRRLLSENLLESVYLYPERARLFATVNQPTAVAVLARRPDAGQVNVNLSAADESAYPVSVQALGRLDQKYGRIPRVGHADFRIYEALASFPRIRELTLLHNARGELDLSIDAAYVTERPTGTRLIRGDHIERYVLRSSTASRRASFVSDGYLLERRRSAAMNRPRVVGRQVSYLDKARRLSFVLAPSGSVVANSCNYLQAAASLPHNEDLILLKATTVLLNSLAIEWFFRVFNSNNHVANYEIDEFPTCFGNPDLLFALAKQSDLLHAAYADASAGAKGGSQIEDVADALVAWGFGLTGAQLRRIASELAPGRASRLEGCVDWLRENGIDRAFTNGESGHNHEAPTLSGLDMQILRHVPQGGNWQNIPTSVPSSRLAQIRRMTEWRGLVRTTYYGRLRPDQPAYTIATYYNRPGNGTNIHPWEDRTLSSREAARLQSFPDWFVFVGPEASIRKQIGNAVPPLLAYEVAGHLRRTSEVATCVDLFSGAGGLSLGLEMAGWNVVAAVDNDRRAMASYMFNRPCETRPDGQSTRTLALPADLTDPRDRHDVVHAVLRKLEGRPLGLLVGGPPCQGFSHAGWRAGADERNRLASVFLKLVDELAPTAVLLENVEGLLSYGGGKVIADLLLTLRELGYEIGDSPWLLKAECFGVPQMRRRVFLVATRAAHHPGRPSGYLAECRGRREADHQELFSLPYPVTVAEALWDLRPLRRRRYTARGRRPVRPAYSRWLKGLLPAEALRGELSRTVTD